MTGFYSTRSIFITRPARLCLISACETARELPDYINPGSLGGLRLLVSLLCSWFATMTGSLPTKLVGESNSTACEMVDYTDHRDWRGRLSLSSPPAICDDCSTLP